VALGDMSLRAIRPYESAVKAQDIALGFYRYAIVLLGPRGRWRLAFDTDVR
jgi:hypothetical protein